jgi:uncharacterized protein YndB with AHSA1/START domain
LSYRDSPARLALARAPVCFDTTGDITVKDQNYQYEKSITVKAPPQTVYEALTAAGRLQQWFMSRAETDPRPGGPFTFAWEFADAAQNGKQQGRFVELVPGQKVSYTWQARPAPAELTTVSFTLAPEGDGTRVHLAHTGFGTGQDGEAARDQHAGPWDFYLSNLKSYLEEGADNRAAALGQKTA